MCKLTTCCCCIPLRPGLLIVGYLNLIGRVGFLINAGRTSADNDYVAKNYSQHVMAEYDNSIIAVVIIDTIFTVILIVAAHKRSAKLMKVYYVYSIIEFIAACIICALLLYSCLGYSNDNAVLYSLIIGGTLFISLQVYSVSLVKSAMEKFQGSIGGQKVYHQPQLHGVVVNQTPCPTIQQPQGIYPGYQSPPSYGNSVAQQIPMKY